MKYVLLFVCVGLLGLGGFGCKSTSGSETSVSNASAKIVCPTCKKEMTTAATTKNWNGKTYGFCCGNCEATFVKNPEQYTK